MINNVNKIKFSTLFASMSFIIFTFLSALSLISISGSAGNAAAVESSENNITPYVISTNPKNREREGFSLTLKFLRLSTKVWIRELLPVFPLT